MSINMNGILRGLIGDSAPGDAKTFELKPGQIVKGTVLQVSGDQEALVNINGIVVKARLETPLQPGQVTTLQVQPETTAGGQIVLKPLQQSEGRIADDSLADLIKNMGSKICPPSERLFRRSISPEFPCPKRRCSRSSNWHGSFRRKCLSRTCSRRPLWRSAEDCRLRKPQSLLFIRLLPGSRCMKR